MAIPRKVFGVYFLDEPIGHVIARSAEQAAEDLRRRITGKPTDRIALLDSDLVLEEAATGAVHRFLALPRVHTKPDGRLYGDYSHSCAWG
jgi:hypothetical protein